MSKNVIKRAKIVADMQGLLARYGVTFPQYAIMLTVVTLMVKARRETGKIVAPSAADVGVAMGCTGKLVREAVGRCVLLRMVPGNPMGVSLTEAGVEKFEGLDAEMKQAMGVAIAVVGEVGSKK